MYQNEQFSALIWSTDKMEEEKKINNETKYLISFVNPILMWEWNKSRMEK